MIYSLEISFSFQDNNLGNYFTKQNGNKSKNTFRVYIFPKQLFQRQNFKIDNLFETFENLKYLLIGHNTFYLLDFLLVWDFLSNCSQKFSFFVKTFLFLVIFNIPKFGMLHEDTHIDPHIPMNIFIVWTFSIPFTILFCFVTLYTTQGTTLAVPCDQYLDQYTYPRYLSCNILFSVFWCPHE